MENATKAAKVLSEFDMKEAKRCAVSVYFYVKKTKRFIGVKISFPHQDNYDFLAWEEEEWEAFIKGKAEFFANLNPERVVALRVQFYLSDDLDAPQYCIELTDLTKKDGFDRILFLDPPMADMYLTAKESRGLHGVNGVAKLSDKVSKNERKRRRKIGTDLPEAMLQ